MTKNILQALLKDNLRRAIKQWILRHCQNNLNAKNGKL